MLIENYCLGPGLLNYGLVQQTFPDLLAVSNEVDYLYPASQNYCHIEEDLPMTEWKKK
tara:strand:+ start:732 stop:905 length:174 start_codon:yes stop_codon:yes gene_type:complete